jgi:hypothetical protein
MTLLSPRQYFEDLSAEYFARARDLDKRAEDFKDVEPIYAACLKEVADNFRAYALGYQLPPREEHEL